MTVYPLPLYPCRLVLQRKRPASERPPRPSKVPAVSRAADRRDAATTGAVGGRGDARGNEGGGKAGGRGRSGDGGSSNASDGVYTNGTMDNARGDGGGNEEEVGGGGGGGEVGDYVVHSSVPKEARGKRGSRGGQRGNNPILENNMSTSRGGGSLTSGIPEDEESPHTESGGVANAPTLSSHKHGHSPDKDKGAVGDSPSRTGAEGLNSSGTVVGRVGGRTLKVKISMKQRL